MVKKIKLENTVILDTETTGLGDDDEIVQIAIIDGFTGKVLLNEKLKPIKSIMFTGVTCTPFENTTHVD